VISAAICSCRLARAAASSDQDRPENCQCQHESAEQAHQPGAAGDGLIDLCADALGALRIDVRKLAEIIAQHHLIRAAVLLQRLVAHRRQALGGEPPHQFAARGLEGAQTLRELLEPFGVVGAQALAPRLHHRIDAVVEQRQGGAVEFGHLIVGRQKYAARFHDDGVDQGIGIGDVVGALGRQSILLGQCRMRPGIDRSECRQRRHAGGEQRKDRIELDGYRQPGPEHDPPTPSPCRPRLPVKC
jgi:hypothetical protein